MQFYDVIKNRTSIKSFSNTPIQQDKLDRILNAVSFSPSWKNNKSYKFILVQDSSQKEQLAKSIVNDTNSAAESLRQAPLVAVIVADPSQSGIVSDKEYYLVDSAIAMEHFVLAATNEGYGTCWIGSFNEDIIKSSLSIPNNYKVVAMTPVGEIAEYKEHYEKVDIENYIFFNTWNTSHK